jgi:hydroxyethylthiazole kinase-like uncharacterized protein yjeF
MKLPTSREMRAIDNSTIEDFNIPGIVLMENAGLGTVRMIKQQCGSCKNTFAPIFIGPGNNGGDGLVIGRHLYQRGCQPIFFFLVNPDSLKGEAAMNLKIIQKIRLPLHIIDNIKQVATIPNILKRYETRKNSCYVIVDAIFGIGLSRKVEGHLEAVINLINGKGIGHKCSVVAVDIASGLDSNTGKILGSCIRADFTATYGCAKPGHFVHDGTSKTGKLKVIDIGIPGEVIQKARIRTELSTKDNFKKIAARLLRKTNSHKGTHGHLLIIAGSPGKTGAAILAAKGGMRTGAGLVSLLAPRNLNAIYEISLLEAMTIPLETSTDFFQYEDIDFIVDAIKDKQAVVIGPGLGIKESTRQLVLHLYHSVKCPLVLDADALNILALCKTEIKSAGGPRILTPHPGELGRLIGQDSKTVQENRLKSAKSGCNLFKNPEHDIILILKGAQTLIVTDRGSTVVNTTGNTGMATGGMGDVLSGVVGALICQEMTEHNAAVAGVFLHGNAGDDLYRQGGNGYNATELADRIPTTLNNLLVV